MMKQWNAKIGTVQVTSISHNEVEEWRGCQPGHAPGGSINSSAVAVIAERSRAVKVAVRADVIATLFDHHRSYAICPPKVASYADWSTCAEGGPRRNTSNAQS